MQVGVSEIGTAPHCPCEGGVGEILTMKVSTALIGERVVDGFLKQGPILQTHSGRGIQRLGGSGQQQQRQQQSKQRSEHQAGCREPHSAVTTARARRSPTR